MKTERKPKPLTSEDAAALLPAWMALVKVAADRNLCRSVLIRAMHAVWSKHAFPLLDSASMKAPNVTPTRTETR
jgi:hypothetical protein